MKTAFIFPGQGAQQVGMGKDLYEAFAAARSVFDAAEEASGLPLKKLCFEGPDDELARTDICQPAIFTVSAAALACMSSLLGPEKVAAIRPVFMAGLSLGEYTALFAAGCLDFSDALKLVTRRGAAMQAAATAVPSGMVCIMGVDEAKANELCAAVADGEVLTCANFNCPGQIVISGAIDACRRAEAKAKDFGASGAIPLKVAGAFHCQIMAPAADELGAAISSIDFRSPGMPAGAEIGPTDLAIPAMAQEFASGTIGVISNVDALPYACMCQAKEKLLSQLVWPVRWQQSMEAMLAAGVERFYEIGPGRVLAGLMRRINRKAEVVSVNSKEAVERLNN